MYVRSNHSTDWRRNYGQSGALEEPAAYMVRFMMLGYLAGGKNMGLVAVSTVELQLGQQT